jgi:hypothetical protein
MIVGYARVSTDEANTARSCGCTPSVGKLGCGIETTTNKIHNRETGPATKKNSEHLTLRRSRKSVVAGALRWGLKKGKGRTRRPTADVLLLLLAPPFGGAFFL